MEEERRQSPRISFIAHAEVRDAGNNSRLASRVSDLSAGGCYVDTIHPFPGGTLVHIKIFTETHSFEAKARVTYAHAHLGMGLQFGEVQPASQVVLREWLPATGMSATA